jgi:hypothetical protein
MFNKSEDILHIYSNVTLLYGVNSVFRRLEDRMGAPTM